MAGDSPALSRLFARDYGLVFAALLKARLAPDFSARHFIEKYLDLVFPNEVDWPAIEALLASAQAASDSASWIRWCPRRSAATARSWRRPPRRRAPLR